MEQASVMLLCQCFLKDPNQSLGCLDVFGPGQQRGVWFCFAKCWKVPESGKCKNTAAIQRAEEMVLRCLQLRPKGQILSFPERAEPPSTGAIKRWIN